MPPALDEDAIVAAADIVQRTGAQQFELGYLDDDPANPRWYASAVYRGAKVIVDEKERPEEAADGLARKLIGDGGCTHCNKPIRLVGPVRPESCRWTRMGKRWERGCLNEIEQRPKTRRNDPCPCGSGKKFKQCHLLGPQESPLTPG